MPPRIPPLPESERDAQVRDMLAGVTVAGAEANIFTTLARHRSLLRKWLPFGGKLLNGTLDARLRELVILRTGWNCGAEYEWGQHVVIGREAGLSDAEMARVVAGPEAPGWTELETALLRAADELHLAARIADGTWAVLAGHLDERQLIELCMLVGQYHLVAFTLNSLGVELDPGLPGFPSPRS